MVLAPGTRIGTYEIVAPLGAGGMGEVYRAKDSKLKREVALKVLPAHVANDRERMARFQREAEVLASLNHPHIAQIYGLEENALVMELVEGEDLAERLKRGSIPLDEALPIAKQIAEALEAAHEQGIIHRDLKPANIKVRPDGTVKVLDFGLAKALASQDLRTAGPQDLVNSPTITSPAMTMRGMILGTAAYMAPEQAKGKPVDQRADIWAFGAVLFEMLAGTRAFKGDDVTDIITSVMRDGPDWHALPALTPPTIRTLLRRCLEKDPRKRAPHIAVARLEIDDAMTSPAELMHGLAVTPSRGLSYTAVALIALACIGITTGGVWLTRRVPETLKRPLIRTSFPLNEMNSMRLGVQRHLTAITPDSRVIAIVSNGVQLRHIDQLAWTAVPNTSEATSVFASPDSRWIGFATRSAIWKISVAGGQAILVAQMADTSGLGAEAASWGDDDRIYFTDRNGIKAVAAGGGAAETIAAGVDFGSLDALPARGGVLYSRGRAQTNPTILMHTFDGREDATIIEGLTPRLIAPDLLLFVRGSVLMGARIDLAGRRLLTEPVRLVDDIAVLSTAAQYDVSIDGSLVYLPSTGGTEGRSTLTVRKANGSNAKLLDTTRSYSDPRLSPDGKKLALHLFDQDNDIWILDIGRGAMTRITFDAKEDETPAWSPDGQWIAFAGSVRDGSANRAVFRQRADGSPGEELIWQGPNHSHVTDWSPDGKSILVEVADPKQRSDIIIIDVATKAARPLIATPYSESSARVGRATAAQSIFAVRRRSPQRAST